jgi:Copper type II ascorbate-dependent monooxygenase, C-terminal domain
VYDHTMKTMRAIVLLVAGCGGGVSGSDPGPDAAQSPIDANGEQWVVLLDKAWTLSPGIETTDRAARTLDQDLYVRAIRPLAPLGTHHTLLGVVTPTGGEPGTTPDGLIYASGVGTDALYMPAGVGLRLPAGKQLSLQLHLYNVGDAPLSGTSGIEVLLTTADQIDNLAEIQLAGPLGLSIPPGIHTISGSCTVTAPQSVFAVFPHMHQLGTHLRTYATTAAGEVVLHDGSYNFSEQRIDPVAPVALLPGDRVHTECTWNNTGTSTIGFGSSSDTEMCFSILFRYPAQGGNAFCDDGP